MPTGYTYGIEKNPGYSFRDFVWRCARAFNPLVHLRDEAPDAPIPQNVADFADVVDARERLAEAEQELVAAEAITLREAEAEAQEWLRKALAAWEEETQRLAAIRQRYADMRAQATDWTPPTLDHEGLKRFMIEQLDESTRYGFDTPARPVALTASEWHQQAIEEAKEAVDWARRDVEQELQNAGKANDWLQALRESVPPPADK